MNKGLNFARKPPWDGESKEARDVKHRKEEPAPVMRKDGSPVTMANVAHRECRWMNGPPGATTQMCGHPTVDNGPWCAHHKERSRSGAIWRPR